jgi:hypothetical protein
MNFSRPVKARATRSACIVASVPVFVRRTLSTLHMRMIRSASVISAGVVQAKMVPLAAASCTFWATAG